MSAGDATTVRIADYMMGEASALIEPLQTTKPGLRAGSPGNRISKATVIRLATHKGLEMLREECARDGCEVLDGSVVGPVGGGKP